MITVISGTSRMDSNTLRVANYYLKLLNERSNRKTMLLSLKDVNVWERGTEIKFIENQFLIPATHFVFIMPEYNGSFPGILKTMMDNTDIKACWWGKKALLTGIADGRAGNLRGMEHMTGILNYLHINVFWDKLPLSRINDEIDEAGNMLIPATRKAIEAQIDGFLAF